jgi:tyrosyl-tRNA synthetase
MCCSQPPRQRNVVDVLRERGLLDAVTNEAGLRAAASLSTPSAPLRVYCGFDPTAPSLHLGNLLGIIVLAWFQRCGHTPVALVGGATGRVGDPSGKARINQRGLKGSVHSRLFTHTFPFSSAQSTERPVLDDATIDFNVAGIAALLTRLLPAGGTASDGSDAASAPIVLNNIDWFGAMPLLDFLRDVGKHARVGVMLAKDSVKARMGTPGAEGEAGEGMSYTEFTYQLLQAYDFSHLFKTHNVSVQARKGMLVACVLVHLLTYHRLFP